MLTKTSQRLFGNDSNAQILVANLTIGVDLLYNLLYFCLSGVQVECTQHVSDLVRVNFSISTFVKQGECIPVFCMCVYVVCVCVCVCVCEGEGKLQSLHLFFNCCMHRLKGDLTLLEATTPPLNK